MNNAHRRAAAPPATPSVALEQLDLNLLVTLEAVYRERNLTRAARRLFVTQSAVSHALARLRAQLGDPLFVRRASGVEPTPVTVRLAPQIGEALRVLRRALASNEFEPARDLGRVRVAIHDELEPAVLPGLARRLAAAAAGAGSEEAGERRGEIPGGLPGAIECVRVDRANLERDLGSCRIDLAIDAAPLASPELCHRPVFHDRFYVVSRRATRLSAAGYLAARHVMVSSRRTGLALEDILLGQLGVERRVAMRCQRYEAACCLVKDAGILLTAPRMSAGAVARRMRLALLPLPFRLPPFEVRMYWHRQLDGDPRNQWLRAQVERVTAELAA